MYNCNVAVRMAKKRGWKKCISRLVRVSWKEQIFPEDSGQRIAEEAGFTFRDGGRAICREMHAFAPCFLMNGAPDASFPGGHARIRA